jgi:hypothetical protein
VMGLSWVLCEGWGLEGRSRTRRHGGVGGGCLVTGLRSPVGGGAWQQTGLGLHMGGRVLSNRFWQALGFGGGAQNRTGKVSSGGLVGGRGGGA